MVNYPRFKLIASIHLYFSMITIEQDSANLHTYIHYRKQETYPVMTGSTERMKIILQKLPFLFNASFVVACIVHICIIAYNIKHPDFPSVKVYSRNLKDLQEFPLSFTLCAKELINISDRYRKFGYNDAYAFFQGRKDYFHGEWFGWAGHGEGEETLASVEGMILDRKSKYLRLTSLLNRCSIKCNI